MKRLPAFEIAMTQEYVGPLIQIGVCFQAPTVSHRFRECPEKLEVETAQHARMVRAARRMPLVPSAA